MAIYHCSIKLISRGAGQSAVASAAYRHACKLEDTRTGEIHDYTKKQGLESSDIYLPSGVNAKWATDREQLWNAVESAEKRVNSRLGRDLILALPSELSVDQRRELAGEMARHLADRYGVAVDVAIHQPSRQGDQRNHHAHMLMSSRRITPQGFGEKARELDDRTRGPVEVEHIRATWADMANRALERAGQHVQIDHRSLKAQGIQRFPHLHLGASASAMERRGIKTRIGEQNRVCDLRNSSVIHIGEEQDSIQQAEKRAQETSRAREWISRGEELRQKEKEAGEAARAFFGDATQGEGRNGLFEAQKAYETVENSGYRDELNRIAHIAKPNVVQKALEEWKRPYLELIKKSYEDKKVIDWCLNMARYDATLEGQKKLKGIENTLLESLKTTGWSISKKNTLVSPAMDIIRVQENRQQSTQEAVEEIQQQVHREFSRGRGR